MYVLVQEATHREELLESKLTALQRQLQSTQEATECNWQVCNLSFCSTVNSDSRRLFTLSCSVELVFNAEVGAGS